MIENFQVTFFESLVKLYTKRADAMESFAQLLNLSKDSIYRRVRGDTTITLEDMKILTLHHKFSLDKVLEQNKNDVLFTFNSFEDNIKSVEDFVNNLIGLLHRFSMVPDAKVLYASAEIPVFYHPLVPELFAFKLYVWARTVWNIPYFQGVKFSPALIPADTRVKFKEITNLYKHLSSVELWSYNIFDNTLNQIEYYLESGMFEEPIQARDLCDSLEKICDHMRNMAIEEKKGIIGDTKLNGATFQLYHNEIVYTNNTILYTTPDFDILFTTFCSPNFILTRDDRIIDFSKDWFNTVINRSQLISGNTERQRNKYFDGIKKRIALTKRRIEVLIGI